MTEINLKKFEPKYLGDSVLSSFDDFGFELSLDFNKSIHIYLHLDGLRKLIKQAEEIGFILTTSKNKE
jgi:hypothetical protein